MLAGSGEWIWRPVTNRSTLQISSFVDQNPKGFGALQRNRDFEAYQDDELKWELRPSLWVEPLNDFGPGVVTLVEIPAESETISNCVAYWRPNGGIVAGKMAILAEGDARQRTDIRFLAPLPLFNNDGSIKE